MIGRLLKAVETHQQATGHLVAVGERPADVDPGDGRPFAVLYSPSSTFEDDDVESVDRAGSHLITVQTWGRTFDSARLLSEALDDRMNVAGIAPEGHVVTLVKRDGMVGPTRDDQTYPEPSQFRVDATYRLWTEQDLSE